MWDRLKTGELAVILRDIPNHVTTFGGLDLYVSSDGGEIEVDSEAGRGTKVTVRLPVAKKGKCGKRKR